MAFLKLLRFLIVLVIVGVVLHLWRQSRSGTHHRRAATRPGRKFVESTVKDTSAETHRAGAPAQDSSAPTGDEPRTGRPRR